VDRRRQFNDVELGDRFWHQSVVAVSAGRPGERDWSPDYLSVRLGLALA
jgi:hypothetical protein